MSVLRSPPDNVKKINNNNFDNNNTVVEYSNSTSNVSPSTSPNALALIQKQLLVNELNSDRCCSPCVDILEEISLSAGSQKEKNSDNMQSGKNNNTSMPLTMSLNVNKESEKNINSTTKTSEKNIYENNKKSESIQTGMDRYITITKKRKLSPQKAKAAKITKVNAVSNTYEHPTTSSSANRFAILSDNSTDNHNNGTDDVSTNGNVRPPPIFLREAISSDLVKSLTTIVGNNNFHVVSQRKGNIKETKIQIYNEKNYRIVSNYLNEAKKSYYTYQLKSSKGLVVVIKGIESSVDPEEIKIALDHLGFETKLVINIFNKNKVPQPMFKVELAPSASKLRRNDIHPIYNLRYLLHRRVQVEEPHKRNGPVQCTNCQEFGHTKSYCTLRAVCVACGDFHQVAHCTLKKDDKENIKCGNCGKPHTANYRGCEVYIALKQRLNQRVQTVRNQPSSRSLNFPNANTAFNAVTPGISYANALRSEKNPPNISRSNDHPQNIPLNNNQTQNIPLNNVGLESTMNAFIQSMNVFMQTMTATMQDLSKTQGQMLQILMAQK